MQCKTPLSEGESRMASGRVLASGSGAPELRSDVRGAPGHPGRVAFIHGWLGVALVAFKECSSADSFVDSLQSIWESFLVAIFQKVPKKGLLCMDLMETSGQVPGMAPG